MYFNFKLTFVLLILYLKLNGLKTSPVIDRNKIPSVDHFENARNTKIVKSNNSNGVNDYDNTVYLTFPEKILTNDYDNDEINNNSNDNANTNIDKDSSNRANNNLNTKSTTTSQQQINTTRSNLMTNNFITIKLMKNNTFNQKNDNSIPKTNASDNARFVDSSPLRYLPNLVNAKPEKVSPLPIETSSSTVPNDINDVVTENDGGTNSGLGDNWLNSINISDIDSILRKYESETGDTCFLDIVKDSFVWWIYPNGSLTISNADSNADSVELYLDLSARNFRDDFELFVETYAQTRFKDKITVAFSAANNQLTKVPYNTLSLIRNSLQYLSLRSNYFLAPSYIEVNGGFIGWATFPTLPKLIELDISNCRIEYITKEVFQNMANLRNLYMSHNKILQIPADTFHHVPFIQYLDLSFTNSIDYTIPFPTFDAIWNLIKGVKVSSMAFKNLSKLEYLDFSHTKLTRNSAVAFTHLGENLKFLSLCHTAFPMIGSQIFKNTALMLLDLSGNPYSSYNIMDDAFDGVSDTLKYLFFERSNIKELHWLQNLTNIHVLSLSGNDINTVSLEALHKLPNLQMLDISANHVGNWYNRIFRNNSKLRVLNLRSNNINILTSEMLKDFQPLEYLGFGDNDFVCDCVLREMVEIAAKNNKEAECSHGILSDAAEIIGQSISLVGEYAMMNLTNVARKKNAAKFIDIGKAIMGRYMPFLKRSYRSLRAHNVAQKRFQLRFFDKLYRQVMEGPPPMQCNTPAHNTDYPFEKLNSSTLKFQLLDYEDEHYWCFNETQRMNFVELNCQRRNYVDDLTSQLHILTKYVLGSIGALIGITLLGVIIYLKRWHIHYYYSSLKSAALLSVAHKESADQFNEFADTDPNLVYDIFISYCQSDRQWVLEELLPNVEEADDISICMHERDFQIGLTILDNIISCMDRSKALMLIISRNFLLSHWCQFEMHLAQHRMFEASKEQLILVFLEDIPRSKRPKTLQYLMEVKTYIKWPSSKADKYFKLDDRKLFWKRLKRSLQNIGINHSESRA